MENTADKAIITVVGKDTVGIIAKVCTYLSENKINVLDISQTIVSGFFNMMMIVDMKQATKAMFEGIQSEIESRFAGKEIVIRAAYSGDETVKENWENAIKEEFPDMEIVMDKLPISICCHTGEGAMGIGITEKMAGL